MTIQEKVNMVLEGWVITGVGIIDKTKYLVVGQWDNDDGKNLYIDKVDGKKYSTPTRMMSVDIQNNKIKFITSLDGVTGIRCDGGRTDSNLEAFFGSGNGATYHLDYRKDTFKHEDLLMHPDTFKTNSQRTIDDIKLIGNHFYTLGNRNLIHRRDETKTWTFLSEEPNEYYKKIGDGGTSSLAAFSEKEMYFSGKKGSLWSYDGKHWDKVGGMPSHDINFDFIECCDDGKVYAIDSHADGVAVGRGTDFKFIPMKKDDPAKEKIVYDTCTFKGKVYITTHTIYEFKDDVWVKADIPEIYGSVEHLAAKDGVMFIGTPYSLKIYNGKDTFTLYGASNETQKLQNQYILKTLLEQS